MSKVYYVVAFLVGGGYRVLGEFIPFLSPVDYEAEPLLHFFDVKEDF